MLENKMLENKIVFKNKKIQSITSCDLGISGENDQETLIFSFEDGFVDGTCNLDIELPNGKKGCIEKLEKDKKNECYKMVVKNSLLKFKGIVKMQLKIIQETAVWKCKDFDMHVLEAINAEESIESEYPTFVSRITTRMGEIEEGFKQVKEKVDEIEVPTKLSDLENDLEFESFSGDYNDLENKPEIPDTSNFTTNEEVETAINNRINELVDGAPETFDTLKEIANYIAEHEEIVEALNEAIGNKANKEDIEGLATEEYVNDLVGDIDTLLSELADESEAI